MAIVPQHFIDPVFLQHDIMKHNGQQLNNSIMTYFGYCIMTFEKYICICRNMNLHASWLELLALGMLSMWQ